MKIFKYKALCIVPVVAALILNGCSSSDGFYDKTHGISKDGATYGSGPNNTRPYPQDKPVNLNGVGGAKIKYEPLSRGGNKNYTVLGKNYQVWRDCTSYQEVGMASWYGPGFHGNKTSNGERYNQKGYSAAHKNLPLPSYLKVTNLSNGKAVIVRVNDRGPFHGSRIIDLSEGAAKAIDMTRKGTAKVKLEYINVRKGNIIANRSDSIFSGQSSSGKDSIAQVVEDIKNGNRPSLGTTLGAIGTTVAILDRVGSASKKISASSLVKEQNRSRQSYIADDTDSAGYDTAASREQNYTSDKITASQSFDRADTNQADEIENAILGSSYSQIDSEIPSGDAYIQFFSSQSHTNATKMQNRVDGKTAYPVIIVSEDGLYRVRIGPVPEDKLPYVLNQIKDLGFYDSFIKRV